VTFSRAKPLASNFVGILCIKIVEIGSFLITLLCPRPTVGGALSDTVIPLSVRPSVCPMAELSSYSHRVTAGHQRCADCEPVRG